MYSKVSRARAENAELTLPARYSGVRFRRDRRADGRDVVIETPMSPRPSAPEIREEAPVPEASRTTGLFSAIGDDDLLLAALIIILAGEGREGSREAVLLLILLLCIR